MASRLILAKSTQKMMKDFTISSSQLFGKPNTLSFGLTIQNNRYISTEIIKEDFNELVMMQDNILSILIFGFLCKQGYNSLSLHHNMSQNKTVSFETSMWPTIHGSILPVAVPTTKTGPFFKNLERGDVVAADLSNIGGGILQWFIGRLRAFEGDIVIVSLKEPYHKEEGGKQYKPLEQITIPPGHVWLEGDNSLEAYDSRRYGPIPLQMIKKRVIGILRNPISGLTPNNSLGSYGIYKSLQNIPPHSEKDIFLKMIKDSGNPNWEKISFDRDCMRSAVIYNELDEESKVEAIQEATRRLQDLANLRDENRKEVIFKDLDKESQRQAIDMVSCQLDSTQSNRDQASHIVFEELDNDTKDKLFEEVSQKLSLINKNDLIEK